MKSDSPGRFLLIAALLTGFPAVQAQRGGGGMPGGGGMSGGGMGGGMGLPRGGGMGGHQNGMGMPGGNMPGGSSVPSGSPRGGPPPNSGGSPTSSMRGGLQLGPPGRWWDDKKFAHSLGLNGDQQKRMDGVFGQNRDALLSRYESVQKAEARLEALTRNGKPSEAALFAEIDHVAQARADLEKVNTHYLLQLREEMTPEQIDRLDDHR